MLADQTAWLTPDGLKCWLVISPDPVSGGASTLIDHYTDLDKAREHVEATLGSRLLVPGHGYDNDLMPGYVGFLATEGADPATPDPGADAPRDMEGDGAIGDGPAA